MEENMVKLHYTVSDEDFSVAGEASSSVKKTLRQLGISNDIIRKVSIAMYECEINMVIHACGGEIDVEITPQKIRMIHKDKGPGIKDIEKAMTEGYYDTLGTFGKIYANDYYLTNENYLL